jgi:signal transduction histidine kinase/ActR/RegA family two-component response regulator
MSADKLEPQKLNILLVEDNPDDAVLLERHLRRNGFAPTISRVETASTMRTALSRNTPPDIILADYHLPNFSGPEALQLLKESNLDIPFIMLSGAVSEQTAVDSMRAGAQDYVSKQNLTRLMPAIERELKEASGRRKKQIAEAALQASEARFHRLVEGMPLGLLIADRLGRIVYANDAVVQLLGYPNEVLIGGLTVRALCPEIIQAGFSATAIPLPFEAKCMTNSGQEIEVLIGIALLNPEAHSEDQQFAAFLADLTLQKKSQEALRQTEKLAVAGRFAASIAHEINNPLEAVTNCLYLASTAKSFEDSQNYINTAQTELTRVSQITVQTLRFFRGSSPQARTDVHELIETVLSLFQPRMVLLQINAVHRFRATSALVAQVGEIRQVITNLIVNAIDALPKGGHITVRTSNGRDWRTEIGGIVVTIADNGIGMNASTATRVFEPFFSTKGETGTGLGLWVSREIVTRHNGKIRVRSRLADAGRVGGSVFRLYLPSSSVSATSIHNVDPKNEETR